MASNIPGSFYDAAYYTDGSKSNYAPYGPGDWADWLAEMVLEYDHPASLLDVGCAYGYLVERLREQGVDAKGFDISEYAVAQASVGDAIWVGDAASPAAYEPAGVVDLVVSTEVGEHLTPAQITRLLSLSRAHGRRMLLLAAMDLGGEPAEDADLSHITMRSRDWWVERAERAGWTVEPDRFNSDERSARMGWAGRFLYLR